MDKGLNLHKNGADADNNATNSASQDKVLKKKHLMYKKEI